MFSFEEKKMIAEKIEELLLSLNHPEMPKDSPRFLLHVEGKETWSWADIQPNWMFCLSDKPKFKPWNERAREILDGRK